MSKHDIGIIGLGVMGRSLALNMADHGYKVAGFNRSYEVSVKMMQAYPHDNFQAYQKLTEFVHSLSTPRKIMLMIKAGKSVDTLIEQLIPLLEKEDIILDCGNSYFKDTIEREKKLKQKGIYFYGVGVSGGEEGARFGPSIMPAGDFKQYVHVQPILENIAAKAEDHTPCCTYIGENGAGHFVKMVHNGIEYADMQIIVEAYLILKHVGKLTNEELGEVFKEYNQGYLNSFLIQITSDIFFEKDGEDNYVLDYIKDQSQQKGTGKWTSEEALHLDVNASMISSAFFTRVMSNNEHRKQASTIFPRKEKNSSNDKWQLIQQVKEGMYCAKIIAYAQGFEILKKAEKEYKWNLSFDNIASIFRAGCIIRAGFLNEITRAYKENKELSNVLFDPYFAKHLNAYEQSLRACSMVAISYAIAIPVMQQALSYFDSLRTTHIGANLIQAQRDYFGAHTFERVDQEGSFHHAWRSMYE